MPEPFKLFISYRSTDAPKVDKIAGNLALLKNEDSTQRYKPWQDKHNLPPASLHWWDAIVDAIDDNQVFVFHISQDSLMSAVCQAELDYAYRRNRPIIPIVLGGEFFLDPQSDKYNLPKETWALIPPWLGERQFLFYMGADFYRQFEMAMGVFRRAWPPDVYAPRPMDPTTSSNQISNHALYDQACDFAERLAFTEAEKYFDILVRRNERRYGSVAAEWLELLRRYAELIEIDALPRSRFTFKALWEEYIALFPKAFLEGLFDPKDFAKRMPITSVDTSPATKGMTADDFLERGKSRPNSDYDLKIADYTQAIHLNPNLAEAYSRRAANYYSKKNYNQALADASEAIRVNPQFSQAYHHRGNSYLAKGNYDRAIADFTEALHLDPQDFRAYSLRGNSYRAIGKYDRAITDYTEALHLNSQDTRTYIFRGIAYRAKNDHFRAIADFSQAIRLNPQYAIAYRNRAIDFHASGNHDFAIADYTEVIRLDPEYADAYVNRGNLYHDIWKEYDLAIADYTEALHLNPHYADAYVGRGAAHYNKGDYDQAVSDYNIAIHIHPNHALAASNLEIALEAMKNRW